MYQITTLDHNEAQQAVAAIQAELIRRNLAAVIAVADARGELIALLRLDRAPLASVQIAANKAWTAAREGKPSFEIGQAARDKQTGFDMAYYSDPRYIGWGGGVPVSRNGTVIGAVAVSGLPEALDMELARLGVDALQNL